LLAALALCAYADWEPLFNNPLPFVFFLTLFTVGTFLHIDIGSSSVLTLNDAIGLAALLAFGPAFGAAVFLVGMMIHIIYERRVIFRRLVFLSIGIVEFFIVGLVYFEVLNGYKGLAGGPKDLLAAIVAGFVLWLFDRVSAFGILAAMGVRAMTSFFNKLKPYAVSLPPLYIWGMIMSFVFHNGGYVFTAVLMVPLLVIYAFFRNQKVYQDTLRETIFSLAKMIDARDSYTALHSEGVAENSRKIAAKIGLSEEEVDGIYEISLLHDIGKVGIHDAILLKPGPLDDAEWELMREHPIIGANLVKNLRFLAGSCDAIRHHHERWDGKGYPDGLKGEEIPLWARIIALCDAWDAMRTDRPYRKALPPEIALGEIKKGSGTQFDPKLVPVALFVFGSEGIELKENEEEPIIKKSV